MRIRDVSASRLDFVWREYASRMRRRDRPRVTPETVKGRDLQFPRGSEMS